MYGKNRGEKQILAKMASRVAGKGKRELDEAPYPRSSFGLGRIGSVEQRRHFAFNVVTLLSA